MTNHEAIQFLDNMKHEEAGRAIGKGGFYAELMGYHVQALNMAIKALLERQRTGRWKRGVCSECKYNWGEDALLASVPNYCPNCGSFNGGEQDGSTSGTPNP